jgi:hypothetical protein
MIDFIPYPKISVFFNVRLYFRRILRLSLRKKFSQSFLSWGKYISFTPFPQAEFHQSLLFSFIRKGFIDQHDRDIIFDLVDEATRFADQPISCPV